MRALGGSIGLAVAVIVFNTRVRLSTRLTTALAPEQLSTLYKSPLAIESFDVEQRRLIRTVYASIFAQEMRLSTYVASAGLLLGILGLSYNPSVLVPVSLHRWKYRRASPSLETASDSALSDATIDGEGKNAASCIVSGPSIQERRYWWRRQLVE